MSNHNEILYECEEFSIFVGDDTYLRVRYPRSVEALTWDRDLDNFLFNAIKSEEENNKLRQQLESANQVIHEQKIKAHIWTKWWHNVN